MNDRTASTSRSPFLFPEPADPAQGAVLAPVLDPRGRIPESIDARLAELARRAQGGDVAARNGLFLALWPRCAPLFRAIRRNDRWRAREGRAWTFDDVEQEAFPIFCELVDAWRSDEPRFAGYFFTRFRWRVIDLLHRWSLPTRVEVAFPDDLEVPVEGEQADQLRLLIDSLFASLSVRDRQVLAWRIIDGRTDAEMAAGCGVCLKTMRRWRQGAFARAQALLRDARDTLRS
jgi:RNA polymerase sigma factor (sigma-70 family)